MVCIVEMGAVCSHPYACIPLLTVDACQVVGFRRMLNWCCGLLLRRVPNTSIPCHSVSTSPHLAIFFIPIFYPSAQQNLLSLLGNFYSSVFDR